MRFVGYCVVLTATLMALGAATLHASWNFAVKRNTDGTLGLTTDWFYRGARAGVAAGVAAYLRAGAPA